MQEYHCFYPFQDNCLFREDKKRPNLVEGRRGFLLAWDTLYQEKEKELSAEARDMKIYIYCNFYWIR